MILSKVKLKPPRLNKCLAVVLKLSYFCTWGGYKPPHHTYFVLLSVMG
nr:MAG TPA: hypothetical protein [Caudoviricetes sp.]